MIELKPCPFCGGEATILFDETVWTISKGIPYILNKYKAGCASCCMYVSAHQSEIYQDRDGRIVINADGAKEAAEAWNRRGGADG